MKQFMETQMWLSNQEKQGKSGIQITSFEQGNKKCEMYLDHNPVWSGDGFYCSKCMQKFVLKENLK